MAVDRLPLVGELSVAIELDDDPELDRGDDTLMTSCDGESRSGILGLGRCQSVILSVKFKSRHRDPSHLFL